MGNVEKWVVLGVLALIVGILVVSLNVDDPLKTDQAVLEGAKSPPAMASAEKTPPAADPSQPELGKATTPAVLDSVVDTGAQPKPPAAGIAIPAGSILKTTEGLQESFMTDAMFYTWKAGDTFPALAQRFYGDPSRLATLKRLNEGRSEVQPGERVLVPIFDLDAVQTAAEPAAAPKSAAAPIAASAPKSEVQPAGAGRVHVVQEGESLWKIAKKELGSGARWNEIYEANRDVLPNPEALHTGQKLRVP